MSESFIVGLFAMIGAILGSIATFFSNRDRLKEKEKSLDLGKMASQLKSFYKLEEKYINAMHEKTGENRETIKKNFRKLVEDEGFERPTFSASSINKIISKY